MQTTHTYTIVSEMIYEYIKTREYESICQYQYRIVQDSIHDRLVLGWDGEEERLVEYECRVGLVQDRVGRGEDQYSIGQDSIGQDSIVQDSISIGQYQYRIVLLVLVQDRIVLQGVSIGQDSIGQDVSISKGQY